ncbi:MAG: XRE family transcriptional regulator [Oscillospiraceae bacterium]|nr:XRE family transcriptional regulator [Oscillospiraceae bacterium]
MHFSNLFTPQGDTLNRVADYFGVTTDFLLGKEQKEKPTLSNKDERDVARDLESIMSDLDKGGSLMFDGDSMTDEAKESIKAAIKLGLQAAKQKNKERSTPNKLRKE